MDFNDMVNAVNDAEQTLKRAELYSNRLAKLLVGRLKHVNYTVLCKLKKELSNFNAKTGEWKK